MKELFREPEFSRVVFFQSLLESANIQTFIRNQNTSTTAPIGFPIPEFYPALCVVNDDDYPEAVRLIRETLDSEKQQPTAEIPCPACGEMNPANFTLCWSCNTTLQPTD